MIHDRSNRLLGTPPLTLPSHLSHQSHHREDEANQSSHSNDLMSTSSRGRCSDDLGGCGSVGRLRSSRRRGGRQAGRGRGGVGGCSGCGDPSSGGGGRGRRAFNRHRFVTVFGELCAKGREGEKDRRGSASSLDRPPQLLVRVLTSGVTVNNLTRAGVRSGGIVHASCTGLERGEELGGASASDGILFTSTLAERIAVLGKFKNNGSQRTLWGRVSNPSSSRSPL